MILVQPPWKSPKVESKIMTIEVITHTNTIILRKGLEWYLDIGDNLIGWEPLNMVKAVDPFNEAKFIGDSQTCRVWWNFWGIPEKSTQDHEDKEKKNLYLYLSKDATGKKEINKIIRMCSKAAHDGHLLDTRKSPATTWSLMSSLTAGQKQNLVPADMLSSWTIQEKMQILV